MGRRLPEYDPDRDGDYSRSKRRLQIFKRIYQNYYHWRSLRESGMVDDIITIAGEEVYLGDLMTGIETLPNRQRQAFELICLRGYTESAATEILLPNSKWSTPVQQYSDDGLRKMVAAYDAKQDGTWDSGEFVYKKSSRRDCKDTPEEQESIVDKESEDTIGSTVKETRTKREISTGLKSADPGSDKESPDA